MDGPSRIEKFWESYLSTLPEEDRILNMSEMQTSFTPTPKRTTDQDNLTVVIRYTALVGFAGHLLFIPLFLWLGIWQMAAINVGSCAIFAFCFWLNRHGYSHTALLLGILEVAAHAALAVAYVGWSSGFHYYILGLTPLIFYSQQWRAAFKFTLLAILGGFYIVLFLNTLTAVPWAEADPARLQTTAVLNIITLFVVFAALASYYRMAAIEAEMALTQANKILEYQAHTDPLTRLSNRREMEEGIRIAMDAYRLSRVPFCIVLSDVDNFKAFNDRYGHEVGDNILVTVADLMRACLRGQDLVARWGGEEFLMLLAATRLDWASQVAERLRERIAATRIAIGNQEMSITMTFGVTEYVGESDPVACIKKADEAMYKGKDQGKNQVVTHTGPASNIDRQNGEE